MTSEQDSALVEAVHKILLGWQLRTIGQEDDPLSGFPLVDAVSPPGGTIEPGEQELGEIAYAIIHDCLLPIITRLTTEAHDAVVTAGRARHERLAYLLNWLCNAYELVCAETGKNYHQSPSSVYAAARAALKEKPNG